MRGAPSGSSAPSLSRRPGPTATTLPSFTCAQRHALVSLARAQPAAGAPRPGGRTLAATGF
jgi:hypothetical protein